MQDGKRIVDDMERMYVKGVVSLPESSDVRILIRKLELYHHLQDARRQLGITLDTLMRIIISYS